MSHSFVVSISDPFRHESLMQIEPAFEKWAKYINPNEPPFDVHRELVARLQIPSARLYYRLTSLVLFLIPAI